MAEYHSDVGEPRLPQFFFEIPFLYIFIFLNYNYIFILNLYYRK